MIIDHLYHDPPKSNFLKVMDWRDMISII